MTPITCACQSCTAMCANTTCLPTPDEARALIRAGFGDRLATYRHPLLGWQMVGPAPKGMEGARDLTDTKRGCTFFDGQHCELHSIGLKPLEGRLAHHSRPWQPIRMHIASHWKGKRFESVVAMLNKHETAVMP